MAEVVIYRLTGTDEARGWLELARSAETIDEAMRCLKAHCRMMRKHRVEKTPTPAVRSRASAQFVRTREAAL